jgi:hypothetical protein
MAKIELNSAIRRIRGTIDNWVYRREGDGVIIGKRPTITAPPTAAQLAVRQQFRAAAAYARAARLNPVLWPRYEAAAKAEGMRSFAFALADFLKEPVVQSIDLSAYHGRVGDLVTVVAFDDFEIAGVAVAIRDGEGSVLEQGAAVAVNGRWQYMATVAIAVGEAVTIEAVATDRPGNTGRLNLPHVVA